MVARPNLLDSGLEVLGDYPLNEVFWVTTRGDAGSLQDAKVVYTIDLSKEGFQIAVVDPIKRGCMGDPQLLGSWFLHRAPLTIDRQTGSRGDRHGEDFLEIFVTK